MHVVARDIHDVIDEFRTAMARAGITVRGEIIADGRIHRANSKGKGGKNDAAYLLHLDHPVNGGWCDWRTGGEWEHWRPEGAGALTDEDRARLADMRRRREAEEKRLRGEARIRARRIWDAARPAEPTHPYLARKGVAPYGIRQDGDELLVPVCSPGRVLESLQRIFPDGSKRFLSGGRVSPLSVRLIRFLARLQRWLVPGPATSIQHSAFSRQHPRADG